MALEPEAPHPIVKATAALERSAIDHMAAVDPKRTLATVVGLLVQRQNQLRRRRTSKDRAMAIPDAALGAVIAATITSLAALLGLIISKETKTSEFRQAWIDALRADIAALIGHLNAMQGTLRISGATPEGWREARDDVSGLNSRVASIRLRLNAKEATSQKLCSSLDQIEKAFSSKGTVPEIGHLEKDLVQDAQIVLKAEWERVKNGELVFVCARSFAFLVLVFALAGLIYLAVWP